MGEKNLEEHKNMAKKPQDLPEEPIKVSWFDRIPFWVKAVFIKYWFFGMTYYFFVTAFGYFFQNNEVYNNNPIISWIIVGCATGFFNDWMVYNILDTVETKRGQSFYWVMFKNKKFYSTLINLVYGLVWSCLTFLLCAFFADLIMKSDPETWWFREAFSFALIGFVIDGAFVGLKDCIYFTVQWLRKRKEGER